MHISFSFHQLNLQLAYTTQVWNFNLKLVSCKHTYDMHNQMHQSSLWACSPYLCGWILIDPFPFIFLPLYQSSPPLSNWSLSFHISPLMWKFSPFAIFSLSLCITFSLCHQWYWTQFDQGQASSHLISRVILTMLS
jgi:hypothetical protein